MRKMTLTEQAAAINKRTGSHMFTEEMGNKCLNFYYKQVVVDGWDLIDADERAHLNTIMGYKLRRQTADALRIELWKRGVEILELNRNQHDRDTIEKVARSLKIKLDWSKWRDEPYEEYEYFA